MKVAVWHNLPSGGGLRAMTDQLAGLARRGHEVHVFSPPTAARRHWDGIAESSHQVPLAAPPFVLGPRQRRLAAATGRRGDIESFVVHSRRCADGINRLRPDVVLAHSCQFFRVPALAQFLEAPSTLYLHEPDRRLFEAGSGAPWAAGPHRARSPRSVRSYGGELVDAQVARLMVGAQTRWLGDFDDVLVNSCYSRESVLRAYDRESRVALLGIDLDAFGAPVRAAAVTGSVLTVGAMVREKNPEFLVRAVAYAGASVSRFVWVANYVEAGLWQHIRRVASSLEVAVDLRIAIPDDELRASYAEADVFVYAPRLEPFGLAPLEAGASGLPVVAVGEAGVRETVVDGVNGLLVEPEPQAFGASVAALLGDPARRQALGASARSHVERHWQLEPAISRLEQQLKRCADGASQPE